MYVCKVPLTPQLVSGKPFALCLWPFAAGPAWRSGLDGRPMTHCGSRCRAKRPPTVRGRDYEDPSRSEPPTKRKGSSELFNLSTGPAQRGCVAPRAGPRAGIVAGGRRRNAEGALCRLESCSAPCRRCVIAFPSSLMRGQRIRPRAGMRGADVMSALQIPATRCVAATRGSSETYRHDLAELMSRRFEV
jgi:hypothetical protein